MTTITHKQAEPTESLHARVPQGILQDLNRIAQSHGRSRNWIFNEALRQYLEVQQWQIDLIKQRLTESTKKNAKFISHKHVITRQEKHLKKKLAI